MFRNAQLMVGALVAVGLVGCTRQEQSAGPAAAVVPGVGEGHLFDTNDKQFELWDDATAKATVVVFTLSDCPVSNRYAPEVSKLYEEFQPQGVRFFLVYVDPKETAQSVQAHLKEYQYPFPGLRDPQHRLVRETGATVTPEAVVFDAQKEITYRGRINDLFTDFGKARDAATTHELADALSATLAGKPVAVPETKAVGCYIVDLQE